MTHWDSAYPSTNTNSAIDQYTICPQVGALVIKQPVREHDYHSGGKNCSRPVHRMSHTLTIKGKELGTMYIHLRYVLHAFSY